ncbi:MAG: class I SAM-dependent methyltransferase [Acidimicrobiales bacterium]|nr:class I SAM-dependent methyltransferase [Acidimicrobiales bacterium]
MLDVGCGHGLLALHLAAGSARREVVGVDIDEAKITAARRAAAAAPSLPNVAFASADDLATIDGPFAAVTVVDVLYLLTAEHQEALVRSLACRLAPGGSLLVKEMAPTPRWKHRWMHGEEVLATRVARITASTDGVLHHTAPEDVRRWMTTEGLAVSDRRLDRRRPYPHHLVVGVAPAAGGSPTPTG